MSQTVVMKAKVGNYKWTARQEAILRQCFASNMSHHEIAATINSRHGTAYTAKGVASRAGLLGLRRPGWRPPTVWTEAMNAELRAGIDAHLTLTVIARGLRLPYSTVNKQMHILGIKVPQGSRPTQERVSYKEQRELDRRHQRRLNALLHIVPREYRREAPLPVCVEVVTDPLNLTLDELGRDQCRWIMNDDLTAPMYCGHAILKGSWCKAHKDVVTLQPGESIGRHLAILEMNQQQPTCVTTPA